MISAVLCRHMDLYASSQMTEFLGLGWVCSIRSLWLLFHLLLWFHAPVPAVWLIVPTSLVRRLSHSTLQIPQTPPLAPNIITFFLGVGSTGAPHKTLALSSFQFLSPDLRSSHIFKPGICHDAVLLSYFLSFNPPWLSSEEKYLTDALCMIVLYPPKSMSGLRDHRGLASLGDQENDLGPSEVQTVSLEIWPYLSESRHSFLEWGRELLQELSSCWFLLSYQKVGHL